jgi:hypothetical protein
MAPTASSALAASLPLRGSQRFARIWTKPFTCPFQDLSREDRLANEQAIAHEEEPDKRGRVLSSYRTRNSVTIWVISERDRSATSLLLPDEY